MKTATMSQRDAAALAVSYARRGIPAGPVGISWDESKGSTTKRPLTQHGFRDFTGDVEQVQRRFNGASLRPGEVWAVGIWPGPAGIAVLDVDVKGGARGDEELHALEQQHGPVTDTGTVRTTTASGGEHIWTDKGGAHVGNADFAAGVEVRADDGFVIAPGVHTPWGSWEFQDGCSLDDVAPAPANAWVMARFNNGAASNGNGHGPSGWRRLSDEDRALLHPATLDALEHLESDGWHSPILRTARDRESWVEITRPRKQHGNSASVGYVGPGAVKVFSSSHDSPLQAGVYEWDDDSGAFVSNDRRIERVNGNGHRDGGDRSSAEAPNASSGDEGPLWAHRLLDGASWLRTGTDAIEPLWGDESHVLVARKQPTVIAAGSGAGKTTLTQRIVLGALGVDGFGALLGYPVTPTPGRVLYLAADRPDQARLSMLRMVTTAQAWQTVHERLVVIPGPPPEDIGSNPLLLLQMARWCNATLVIPDSLKDMALKLSADDVGAKVNQAFQHLVADGRDLIAPHHVRKVGRQDSDRGVTIDDLYGSAWIFNGAGSVLYLEAGPVDVELRQLKTPNGQHASLRFVLSPTGEATVGEGDPILAAVREAGDGGIATAWAAAAAFHKDKPSDAEVERVRKRLAALETLGMVQRNGAAGKASRWVAV